jgi:hypothetical protein
VEVDYAYDNVAGCSGNRKSPLRVVPDGECFFTVIGIIILAIVGLMMLSALMGSVGDLFGSAL